MNAVCGRNSYSVGKTKGGLNTKLVAIVGGLGCTVASKLYCGIPARFQSVAPIVSKMSGCTAVSDPGFDSKILRNELAAMKAGPSIPHKKTSRIDYFNSKVLYAHRHVVDNFFARIKRPRRVATLYETLSETFLGFVILATIIDWLHFEV